MNESVEVQITEKLQEAFQPKVLSVKNESPRHNNSGAESHFAVLLVSDCFVQQTRVERHRAVMDLLKPELEGPIHALSLKLMTPIEYKQLNLNFTTPPCQKTKK